MAAEYLVPLGIDAKKILSDFDETISKLGQFENKASEAGKTLEQAFEKGAKASDRLDNELKPITKSLDEIKSMAGKTANDLDNAFKLKEGSAEFAKKIADFKKKLSEVTDKKTIGIDVDQSTIKDLEQATNYLKSNFDEIQKTFSAATGLLDANIDSTKQGIAETEAYIKDLEKALESIAPGTTKLGMEDELRSARQALLEENAALADYEQSIAEIDAANKNLAKTLAQANTAVEELAASQESAAGSLGDLGAGAEDLTIRGSSLKAQLRAIKAELQQMEMAGQGNTQRFMDLSIQAGELEDQIGDTNAQIRTLASDSKYLDATISGVTGLVGAFTLAQGAAGLLGVENEELEEALLKVNSAMAVLQGLQAVAEALNKDSAFSVIFLRSARTAEAEATAVQTTATVMQTGVTRTATVATKALGLAFKALGIGLVIALIAYLVENWDDLTSSLNKVLPAGESVGKMFDKIKSIVMGVGNAVFQYLVMPFKAINALLHGNLDEFKQVVLDGFNIKKNFTDAHNKQELKNEAAHQQKLAEERIKADERDLERRKNRGENVEKEEIALQHRRLALYEKDSKDYKEALTGLEDLSDKHIKSQADARKKSADDAKKKRDEAAKKQLEDQKKIDAQTLAYARALSDSQIEVIADSGEKERAKINEEYKRKQEDLLKDAALTTANKEDQAKLILAIEAERVAKIAEFDKKEAEDKLKLRLEAQQAIAEMQKDSGAKELELLRINFEERKLEIAEQFKDEAELKALLITALEESTERARKKILAETAAAGLEDEQERQLLIIELASKYAKKSEETERQKQIAILSVKAEFAEKTLNALTASGVDENSLEVLRAKDSLNKLRSELQDEIKKNSGKGFDFLDFIGLGSLDDKQKEMVKKAGASIAESLGQITDFIVDQYQRQIDKKQESIDQLDDEISDLEDRLDEEKDLRESGFANNVEVIEAELAAKQREKDEEVRQQEELQKKKQAMQRAQMVADTAVQLVNMITASTEIFKSMAGIPFVGVPLAIAMIGTMFGAFVLAKVRAAQSISDQKFGEGGWIDGKSHAQGGKKYYSPDGDVRELEKDEFVVRKKQAKKYANLLEAINNGSFRGFDINDEGLSHMLADMGISLSESSSEKALREANEAAGLRLSVSVNSENASMKEMNENIRFLAQQERERVTSWEDEKYIYTKKGSRITRILKTIKTDTEEITND